MISSDTAIATLLVQCQIKNKSFFPKSWAYANGDIWCLGLNLFVMPFTILLHNQSLSRMVGSLSIVLFTSFFIYLHDKKLFKEDSWVISIPIFLLFMYGAKDMNLYQAAYVVIMLHIIISTLLTYIVVWERKSIKWTLLFCIFIILVNITGIREIAEVTIPLWCSVVCILVFENCRKTKVSWKTFGVKLVYISSLILIPAYIGYGIIYRYLSNTRIVNNSSHNATLFTDSINTIWDNSLVVITNMFNNFGYSGNAQLFSIEGIRNLILLFICIVLIFIVPILQARRYKEETKGVRFFFSFVVIHNLIILLIGILFGKIESRYMLSIEYLFIIVSSRYIMKYWIKEGINIFSLLCQLTYGIMIIIFCVTFINLGKDWKDDIFCKKNFCQTLVDYGLGAYKGYATYWNAYTNEIYSDFKLSFASIGDSIESESLNPQKWLVDIEKFNVENKGSFLLLDSKQNETMKGKIEELYGSLEAKYVVDNMFIYVWDYDICQNDFTGQTSKIDYLDKMLLSGAILEEQTSWHIGEGQYILGPLINLKPGKYKLIIDAEVQKESECEITSYAGAKKLGRYILKSGINEFEFQVDDFACQIEFPVYSKNDNSITINHILLEDEMLDMRTDYSNQMDVSHAESNIEKSIYMPANSKIYSTYPHALRGDYKIIIYTEMNGEIECKVRGDEKKEIGDFLLKDGYNELKFKLKENMDYIEFTIECKSDSYVKIKELIFSRTDEKSLRSQFETIEDRREILATAPTSAVGEDFIKYLGTDRR